MLLNHQLMKLSKRFRIIEQQLKSQTKQTVSVIIYGLELLLIAVINNARPYVIFQGNSFKNKIKTLSYLNSQYWK